MDYKTIMTEFEERFKGKENVDIVKTETCEDGISAKRKHFLGVSKMGNKWRARIQHLKLKVQLHLGTYSTPEEAALVVKNKKAEFKEMLSVKRCGDEFQGRKLPSGVSTRECGKFRVRIWHPELKKYASFGNYSTCEEEAVVADRKRAELWELYGGKLRGSSEYEDDDQVLQETETEEAAVVADRKRKQFFGVNKKGNKWQARIRNPKSKFKIHLGYFSTPEEAALAVKKKEAEFEEMFKDEEGLWKKRRRHEFKGRNLPSGVTRECGNFRVRLWHPELKKYASFGYYSTCEEAVVVADRKRAELWEVYGGKVRGSGDCEDNDEVLLECESVVSGKFKWSDEQASDMKVPAGARGVRSDKWVARVKDSGSRARICLGTYDTAEEAVRSKNKKIAVQMDYDGLNNIEILDKPNCGIVDVPDKLECDFVQDSPTSNIKPGTSNSGCFCDKMSQRKSTCSLEFDEAVSAGFVNEFGHLVGKYCELDEQLWLGLPNKNVAASG